MSNSGAYQYWQRTIIQAGRGTITRLPRLLHGLGAKRVLLLSDSGLKAAGIVDRIEAIFAEDGQSPSPRLVATFADIAPEATTESINAALRTARATAADSVLAVGGGSVLDSAKLLKLALHHGAIEVEDLLRSPFSLLSWPEQGPMGVPHVSVPTTAGTGAEVTNGAVIQNSKTGIKHLIGCPYLESDIAVLDPGVTLGLPRQLTAATGLDALTHAIETLAIPNANDFSLAHAMYASQMIFESLPKALDNGHDVDARAAMLSASAMACNALANNLGPGPVHNFSHAFGAMFHIHHGEANGVLLPLVIEHLPEYYSGTAVRLARAVGVDAQGSPEALVRRVAARIREFVVELAHPVDFKRYAIAPGEAEKIVMGVAHDPLAALYPIAPDKILAIAGAACGWH